MMKEDLDYLFDRCQDSNIPLNDLFAIVFGMMQGINGSGTNVRETEYFFRMVKRILDDQEKM